jgi:hypothetical protein
MTDQRCLAAVIVRQSALTAGPLSSTYIDYIPLTFPEEVAEASQTSHPRFTEMNLAMKNTTDKADGKSIAIRSQISVL